MMRKVFFFMMVCLFTFAKANTIQDSALSPESDSLVVLWTSGDKEVAMKMVCMYTYYSKKNGWWDDVTLIVWGPSSKLLSEDKELQDYIKKMQDEGIHVQACVTCAKMYGVDDILKEKGIEVIPMGKPLTDYMKSGRHVLTF